MCIRDSAGGVKCHQLRDYFRAERDPDTVPGNRGRGRAGAGKPHETGWFLSPDAGRKSGVDLFVSV